MPLFEDRPQRFRNSGVVFFAADFFFFRAGERNKMITRDTAFLGLKFRECDRLGKVAVIDHDCHLRERLFRFRRTRAR